MFLLALLLFVVFLIPLQNTFKKKTHSGLEKWGETGEETIDSKTHAKKKKR